MLSTIFEVIFLSGARPALLMGVAPEIFLESKNQGKSPNLQITIMYVSSFGDMYILSILYRDTGD